ncbi:MAG: glycosyltransferase family 9 protein [Nitrospirae bacterium]|nr:glycosyltransferase family 9 protein [Nitrospirota bacterium]MBF0591597.1 glycosyltransferase family 9 protein [Nitrospirota bacterium]
MIFRRFKIINRRKLLLTAMADFVGEAIFLPVRLLRGRVVGVLDQIPSEADVREILVVRTSYLGDVIMTLPILRPLKERFPRARLTFLTSKAASEVLMTNPYVDEVITYDPFWFYPSPKSDYIKFIWGVKRRSFDLVIEARGDIRELMLLVGPLRAACKVSYDVGGGGFLLTHVVPYEGLTHKVQYHMGLVKYLGCRVDVLDWGFYLTQQERARALKIINDHNIEPPFVAIHPGSRLSLKKWPLQRYAMLCDIIAQEYNMPVVVFGSAADRDSISGLKRRVRCGVVDLSEALTLREFAGVIAHSRLLVCNDSAPMHVAACEGVPVVAIFGPSKSVETAPYGDIHRVVQKGFPCRTACDESTCHHTRHHACMTDISVQDVFDAVRDQIYCHSRENENPCL